MISDADEITSPEAIKSFNSSIDGRILHQKFFYYRLNCIIKDYTWAWSKIVSGKMYNTMDPQSIRYAHFLPVLETFGGWHFSFIGTPEMIASKIKAFAHQEYNRPEIIDVNYVKKCMDIPKDIFKRPEYNLKYVAVDESFPKYVRDNYNKYINQGLIKAI
jgi:beta-1,4-mannosyl-glycoprotein beta-1,4-N-acetylglucosaminyltransferase